MPEKSKELIPDFFQSNDEYNIVEAYLKELPLKSNKLSYALDSITYSTALATFFSLSIAGVSAGLLISLPIVLFLTLKTSFHPLILRDNIYNYYLYYPRPANMHPVSKKAFFRKVKLATLTRFTFRSSKTFSYNFHEGAGESNLEISRKGCELKIRNNNLSLSEWDDSLNELELIKELN